MRTAALMLALALTLPAQALTPVRVAAASDLQYALSEIAGNYQTETGEAVQLTFGSSGNFARQIAQGAPFQIFLSADDSYVERLADEGYTQDRGTNYARGRIVLYTSDAAHIRADWEDVRAALADGRLQHFAIANPDPAPYGRAAREALNGVALWAALQKSMVLGENVSQAAQFVLSGAAQAAIVPYSLVLTPQAQARGRFLLLPDTLHAPLVQRMVLLKGADAAARRFFLYLQQPPVRAILQRYGFTF
jgi:molybdate transport system substrate-binding protein